MLIFIVASLIALILNPFVDRLHRIGRAPRARDPAHLPLAAPRRWRRSASLLAQPISNQVTAFQHSVPHLVNEANKRPRSLQTFLNHHGIHIKLEKQGQTALQTSKDKIVKGSSSLLSFTTSLLTSVANAAIALVLIFVVSVYLLVYAGRSARSSAACCRPATARGMTTTDRASSAPSRATSAASSRSAS